MKIILTLIFLGSFCSACQAPLFNHKNAGSLNVFSQLSGGNNSKPENDCQFAFPNSGFCAKIEWTKQPSEDQAGQFQIWFWNPAQGSSTQGPFVTPPYIVKAKLWMGSMGHGSAPITVMALKDAQGNDLAGRFVADNVSFVMPGDWEVWIMLTQSAKIIEKAKIDINVN